MSALSPERARARACKAGLTANGYPPDHPRVVAADRDIVAGRLEQYITEQLAKAPPLTREQRARLAELLKPVRPVRPGALDPGGHRTP
jgi:hypothetical protein